MSGNCWSTALDRASDILDRSKDRLGSWLDVLQARMHPNKAVVALAANSPDCRVMQLTKPEHSYERRDPAFA